MTGLFLKILNMSLSSCWLILAALVLRFVFKKAPRWVSVLLWGIVALRLICPFSIESALSLVPSAKPVTAGDAPTVHTGIAAIDSAIKPAVESVLAPTPQNSADPIDILLPVLSSVWLAGAAALILYTVFSFIRLRYRLREAVRLEGNVFECDRVSSPFILGVFSPRIYVPFSMDEKELECVLRHERAHLGRKDHLIKPFGFLLLAIYWFNPLMWLAYILLCRDIELACDEKVIKEMGSDERADYSRTLLALSINRRAIAACPLAFGEVGIKARIKGVLNYKKPAFWVIVLALLACAAAAVCFLTDPKTDVPSAFGAVYKPGDIIYESGSAAIEDISFIILDEGTNALTIDGIPMGSLHELELTKANFDNYFRPNKAPKALKRGAVGAWRCITDGSGDMYYLIQTKDKLYFAAGWFDEEGLSDPYSDDSSFRWVMELEETEYEAAKPTIPEIFMASMKDPSLDVTDFVLATDEAHGLEAVVQYDDGNSHAWQLGFIKDGVSFPVALELDENQIIAGSLTYAGGGTVSVMVKNTENGARHEYSMSFSSDEDGINFVSGVKETVPPQDSVTDIAEPVLNLATLKDLVSRLGVYLTWEDFAPYYGEDVGSGLYIMRYVLKEDEYTLWIGGAPSLTPMYMTLAYTEDGTEGSIDVRIGDIDAFLQGSIVYNWDKLFEIYLSEDASIAETILTMNRDAALIYCFQRFDEGVLEGLTLEGKGVYNAMYSFFSRSKTIGDTLENIVLSPQQDWLDWSDHVKTLYERNGLSDVVFNEDSYCSTIYARMIDEGIK